MNFTREDKIRIHNKKIKIVSTSGYVIFCLSYKHTNNDVFDDSPKISDHFPKISSYLEGDKKKFLKTINNFKKRVVTPIFYVIKWKWQAYSTRD